MLNKDVNEYTEFEAMLNEYLPPEQSEGNKGKVLGKIADEDRNYMYLDAIGQPTVIRVRKEELDGYKIGDEVEVALVGELDDGDVIIGSRKRVLMEEGVKFIDEAFANGTIVNGRVIKKINGGFILEFMGHQGFLPNSLAGFTGGEEFVGTIVEIVVKDVKEDKKGKKIVFSRKEIIGKEIEKELAALSVGDIFDGEVVEVLAFGIGVRSGSVRGFVHISEVSWEKVGKLEELFHVGDIVKCKVSSVDLDKKQLKLSIRDLTKNPWETLVETFKVGDIVDGKVSRVEPYGVFVNLVQGVEGLVHVSDFTWSNKKINAKDYVQVGDSIKVKIVEFEEKGKRVKLGIKQLSVDPWDGAEEKYAIGSKVSGKVAEVKDFGIFVEADNGVTIFVHQSDISWIGEEKFKVTIGSIVDVAVTELDLAERKIKGSLKALRKSPWDTVKETYKVGDIIEKPIKSIIDAGVFMTLEKGVDGFIPTPMLTKAHIKKPDEAVKIGDILKAEIIEMNDKTRKIKLSAKKVIVDTEKAEEHEMMSKYSVSSSEE